jgi:pyruvate formate lyase activating enzyme
MAGDWLDGINIDLKSFSQDFYKTLCRARLEPVLENIRYIARNTDIWLEITTLVIPGENDSEDELTQIAEFIATEAGENVPWHISRFYPNFEFESSSATPVSTIEKAYEIAEQAGLKYVYQGNVPGSKAESTFCPDCGEILIERLGYNILRNKMLGGNCPECCLEILGIF